MTTLPTLYKRTSTGALQEWTVISHEGAYWTRFGRVGGKIQDSEKTWAEGTNEGRTNARSNVEQAEFEAKALWEKKLKKDYTLNPDVKAGETSELIEGGILPMLAHKFSEHGDKLVYPCFVQPKLDGHRCIAQPGRGMALHTLWSRTRKPIRSMLHIQRALVQANNGAGLYFDGELYNHAYRDKFEQLTHFIRQSGPEPGCEVVQYHVYDMPEHPGTFRARLHMLQSVFNNSRDPVVLVETREVQNEDELMLAFEDFLQQGYEGAIARNADGLYVNKRSYDLFKLKKFDDAEFTCIRVEEGRGKMAGHAIFVCQLPGSYEEFKAKMKGDHAELARYFKHPKLVIGRQITVKYQGLTGKNKVPRFPVAWRIAT